MIDTRLGWTGKGCFQLPRSERRREGEFRKKLTRRPSGLHGGTAPDLGRVRGLRERKFTGPGDRKRSVN